MQPGDHVNILLVDLWQRLYRRRRFEAEIVNQSDAGGYALPHVFVSIEGLPSGEVVSYLEALAREAERARKPVVVVLDNAPFHKAGAVRDEREGWEARGLCASVSCPVVLPTPEPPTGGMAQALKDFS